jgi:hypothetical protein
MGRVSEGRGRQAQSGITGELKSALAVQVAPEVFGARVCLARCCDDVAFLMVKGHSFISVIPRCCTTTI